ncbi:SDR family oxidoreductase [Halochromatium salexigens]|uniref:NAD(P)-dependent oxidoreductase n=1 Tax=Halochromatium salexigens TaxID=49447 RepID=A0AAJ0UDD0_HALSE|nr:SDR family oxidoreductase [Halochromatium salexigens]MBK5929288.1 NAD(P)-dependent oxidoreductase [Halochromatium salexigens]
MIILGCGYIGQALAQRYRARGEPVLGVVRSAERATEVERAGARALQRDLAQDDLAPLEPAGQQVFHLAPPPNDSDEDPLTAHLIDAFERHGHPRRLVYIGTTGVYGDCGGAWVDEDWQPRPSVGRSRRRWDAEQRLRRWSQASGAELVILRVAGIYACDRLPLARIRSAQPVVRAEEAPWSNRIHAEDLVTICLAAMERAPAGAVYNVCDGQPSTMTDYFCQVADAAGLPRPPQIPLAEADGQLSAGMLSYLKESRRLSNRRLLDELGVSLRFPDLATGLAPCF